MKYIALFRGINVGTSIRIDMKKLKELFLQMGFQNVSTYINSGNIIFNSKASKRTIIETVKDQMIKTFEVDIPTIIKSQSEIQKIVTSIPEDWQNNDVQRSDVAFLFSEIDSIATVDKLPIIKDYVDIRYVKGAIFWNIERENVIKSQLGKIIGCTLYPFMTIRNINTARYLSNH
jgi:uncharacterized protein (DUF1697 family)